MKRFIKIYLNVLYLILFLLLIFGTLVIIILWDVCINEYKKIHTIDTIIFFIKIFVSYVIIVCFNILSIKQLNKILKYTTAKKDYILAVVYNLITILPFIWYIVYTMLFYYNQNTH